MPTYGELVAFGGPTLAIWMLQPILSLIDSSFVGISGGGSINTVSQLAAIGPGIAWIDSTTYLMNFVGIATTNLYATALSEKSPAAARTTLSHAIVISAYFGVLLFVAQFALAPVVIRQLCGAAVDSVPYGVVYSRVRSIASLVALPTIVVQAAMLTRRDSITPFVAVIYGGLANILGDIWLVTVLKKGLLGAAIATTFSQFVTLYYLVHRSVRSMHQEAKAMVKYWPPRRSGVYAQRGLLARLGVEVPRWRDMRAFLAFCGPLFFIMCFKAFLWSFTTYAAGSAGASTLAAHQITINLFLCFVIFGDVFSQIAQTYVPTFYNYNLAAAPGNGAVYSLLQRVVRVCASMGVLNAALSLLAMSHGRLLLTRDASVLAGLQQAAPFLALSVLPHSCMALCEGTLLATRDQKFHSLTYLLSGALFLLGMSAVRNGAMGLRVCVERTTLIQLYSIMHLTLIDLWISRRCGWAWLYSSGYACWLSVGALFILSGAEDKIVPL